MEVVLKPLQSGSKDGIKRPWVRPADAPETLLLQSFLGRF
jgi:hypothetical protein